MRRFAIGLLPFSLLLVWLYGCPPKSQSPGEQLLAASKEAGVEVHPEEIFTIALGTNPSPPHLSRAGRRYRRRSCGTE